ncbi:MAG: hypothetical protein WAX44_01980 [Minisyncoccia bacterium]
MEFTWKRNTFMLLGILVAIANVSLMAIVEGHKPWDDLYILIGVVVGFLGTAWGIYVFMSSNFGRGGRRSYIDGWELEHDLSPIPSPRKSGFLMGFATFHFLLFAVLMGMSFFR